jgi:hypothetical protein
VNGQSTQNALQVMAPPRHSFHPVMTPSSHPTLRAPASITIL